MWGRLTYGAEPTAISRFWTRAQWSISSAETARITERHRSTASNWLSVRPGPASDLRLKAAKRYWAMRLCSSSAAWLSRYVSSLRCSTTIPRSSVTTTNCRTRSLVSRSAKAKGGRQEAPLLDRRVADVVGERVQHLQAD